MDSQTTRPTTDPTQKPKPAKLKDRSKEAPDTSDSLKSIDTALEEHKAREAEEKRLHDLSEAFLDELICQGCGLPCTICDINCDGQSTWNRRKHFDRYGDYGRITGDDYPLTTNPYAT